MKSEFTPPPRFKSNGTQAPITEEAINDICSFFSTSFAASSYEQGKIDIAGHIVREFFNITNLSPGYITPTHIVRDINRIDFYEFTDIFFIAYYYHLVTNHRLLDCGNARDRFTLKPPCLVDDNYEHALTCVLTKGFFLNYYTYDSSDHVINDHNIELNYSNFFGNMWLISRLSTANVRNISEEIDKGTTFPSKYLDNAHYIENNHFRIDKSHYSKELSITRKFRRSSSSVSSLSAAINRHLAASPKHWSRIITRADMSDDLHLFQPPWLHQEQNFELDAIFDTALSWLRASPS